MANGIERDIRLGMQLAAVQAPTGSLKALMTELVDYAGLFPPAKLEMPKAVETFHRCLKSADSWALARFICPVSRLSEFSRAAESFLAEKRRSAKGDLPPQTWRLSVLIDGELEENLSAIQKFNDAWRSARPEHKHAAHAVIDTIEIKVQTPDIIDQAVEILPEELFSFFEIPLDGDIRGFATALAGTGEGAKIRTGGVTPGAFPSADRVAEFLVCMNAAEVPFKATAGLHHPVRGTFALTYEPGAPTGVMNGFLNVFVAACMLHAGVVDRRRVLEIINETDASAFRFAPDRLAWRTVELPAEAAQAARETFAICFGSCSFDEPIADLKAQRWL